MSQRLQQTGIFKVKPTSWKHVKGSDPESRSQGISIGFSVLESLDKGEWISWAGYEEHCCYGTYWVIKRDGNVNFETVDQLVLSMGWDASFSALANPPPDCVVQVSVKLGKEYKGKPQYEAGWMNPEHYTPTANESDPGELADVQKVFGSALRAAGAAAARRAGAPAKVAAPLAAPKPPQASTPPAAPVKAPAAPKKGAPPSRATAQPTKAPAEGMRWCQNPISGAWEQVAASDADEGFHPEGEEVFDPPQQ